MVGINSVIIAFTLWVLFPLFVELCNSLWNNQKIDLKNISNKTKWDIIIWYLVLTPIGLTVCGIFVYFNISNTIILAIGVGVIIGVIGHDIGFFCNDIENADETTNKFKHFIKTKFNLT